MFDPRTATGEEVRDSIYEVCADIGENWTGDSIDDAAARAIIGMASPLLETLPQLGEEGGEMNELLAAVYVKATHQVAQLLIVLKNITDLQR